MLQESGHDVIPFCIENKNNQATPYSQYFPIAAETSNSSLASGLRYFYNWDALRKLELLLDAVEKIDVAHLHIYHGKQTPAILSLLRSRNIPTVQTLHEYKLACPTYTMQRNGQVCDLCVAGSDMNCIRYRCKDGSIIRSIIMTAEKTTARLLGDVRKIDRLLCVSDFQRQIMVNAGISPEKLYTLHNCVSQSSGVASRHEGYFLYFGRIEKLKGLKTLVDAFIISGQKLLIAGDGNWKPQLEKLIKDQNHITFLGFQNGDALKTLVMRAMAVVVPSEWNENCPMSVLEAKMAGRPVIGSNIGGIPELIQNGIDGILFEPGNVSDLVKAIGAIITADHTTLSENARADATKRFSKSQHLQALLGHYNSVRKLSAAIN